MLNFPLSLGGVGGGPASSLSSIEPFFLRRMKLENMLTDLATGRGAPKEGVSVSEKARRTGSKGNGALLTGTDAPGGDGPSLSVKLRRTGSKGGFSLPVKARRIGSKG